LKNPDGHPDHETAIEELYDLTKTYLRQETIDPLRSVGRRLGYGLAGSLCIGVGMVFLGIAILRLVPRHLGVTSHGLLSSIVYFVAGAALVAFIGISWRFGMRRR
jgi:hypothetical protein